MGSLCPNAYFAMAKFCWGDDAFNVPLTMLFGFVSALLLGLVMSRTDPIYAVGDAFPTQVALRPVAVVTVAFMIMLYMLYSTQVAMNLVHKKGLTAKLFDQGKLIADRGVINTLEQAWPFLAGMWLHAIFVNPSQAQLLGWLYILFRAPYVIFYGFYGTFNTLCELSTQANYIIVVYLSFAVMVKCLSGNDLYTKVHEKSPWLMILVFIAMWILQNLVLGLTGIIPSFVIVNGVKWESGYEEEEYDEDDDV